MAHDKRRSSSRCPQWCCGIISVMLFTTSLALMIWGIQAHIEHTVATQKTLLSRITDDTPISGFYGPGTWWAWLITLGMSHGHIGMALLRTGELPSEWDYDLIGASFYVVVAAVDLVHKSRTIAQLGDQANESVLLPALVCAERVVSVGTGSSLFSLATALLFGRLSRLRMIGVAAIPVLFALIASGFTLHAHQTISHTAPVIWCSLHDGSTPGKREDIPFTLVDFPAMAGVAASSLPGIYLSPEYWLAAGIWSGVVVIVVFVSSLVRRRSLVRALRPTGWAALITAGTFSTLPILSIVPVAGMGAVKWVTYWVFAWAPIYILAFFPQMGFFPLTGGSVLEMDQIAALLGILVVAAIRTLRPIFKAVKPSADSSEEVPLLPVSSGDGTNGSP
ncbi:hypothetical protein B0H17DRAFT_1334986 [Mycena rosella]|uniref:Uncharacterized protein n=1 Tax=Mycena rosella TaxID=1033263 RepID=A0AAD7D160_MYCRO|nr:hypothetical protein B0H17DRAFT_1334986 [Mycena rosella]